MGRRTPVGTGGRAFESRPSSLAPCRSGNEIVLCFQARPGKMHEQAASRKPQAASRKPQAAAPTLVGEVMAPEHPWDEVAQQIKALARGSSLPTWRAVGHLLIDTIYAGDMQAWRRRGDKDASFRSLARRTASGEFAVSAVALYRSAALVELESRLGVSTWKHLTLSHIRAVFGLPHHRQRDLLAVADREGWTVAQVVATARGVRPSAPGGRPRQPAFVRAIRRLEKLLDDEAWSGDIGEIGTLTAAQVRAGALTVERMQRRCDELRAIIAASAAGSV